MKEIPIDDQSRAELLRLYQARQQADTQMRTILQTIQRAVGAGTQGPYEVAPDFKKMTLADKGEKTPGRGKVTPRKKSTRA